MDVTSFSAGLLIGFVACAAIMGFGVWAMLKGKKVPASKTLTRSSFISMLVTGVVGALAFGQTVAIQAQATPVALDIPVDTIFTSTNSWMTTFAPIAAIGIGITLALAILGYIGKMIASAFH